MRKTATAISMALALLGLGGLSNPALARDHDHGPGPTVQGRMFYDTRYRHDHYYPAPGYVARAVPFGALSVGFGTDRFWFGNGVWYRPYGGSFRVILPPIGITVPILPSAYVSLRIGGLPYYYANGIYYTNVVGGPGYVVVAPPNDAANAQPVQPATPPKPDPIIYPRNGQSAQQTEADRQDCNRWATTQQAAMNDATVFNRAVEACMDGRGYTVR